jgi:hypothetical protein
MDRVDFVPFRKASSSYHQSAGIFHLILSVSLGGMPPKWPSEKKQNFAKDIFVEWAQVQPAPGGEQGLRCGLLF